MEYDELRKKLKKYGYTRKNGRLSELSNKVVSRRKFSNKTLNGTRLLNSQVTSTSFDNAALTGSYFYNCRFRNCIMDMADFEYCEFYECILTSKYKVSASFNESNFINTEFTDITFESCSFSGALFENCLFENVKIEFTTFENSIFRNCSFKSMDMKVLNFDYVEVDNPKMDQVILPIEQIPKSIGFLDYCQNTADNITFGSDSGVILTKEEYWNQVIPLLEEEYAYTKSYFPLANIYITKKEYEKAIKILHEGLEDAVVNRDFRMLKFYCKLIKSSHCFDSHELHSFYHSICRLSPHPGNGENTSLLRGYVRNIGEIKNILFGSTKKPVLHMAFLTNLSSRDKNPLGKLISWIFDISKMGDFKAPNKASLKISENSPLMIDVDILGEEENLACLFHILLSLSDTQCEIPFISMDSLKIESEKYTQLEEQAWQYRSSCVGMGVTLTVIEYYFENCMVILPPDKNIYYYNSNLKQYNKHISG